MNYRKKARGQVHPRPPASPVAQSCGFLSANVGLDWRQWIVRLLSACMFTGLQSNRNKNARKPATIALVDGAWFANRANGASLRGLRGMVRAGEDGNKGKCGEMINDNGFSLRKSARRYASQVHAKLFSFFSCSLSRSISTHLQSYQRKLIRS